jgi:hypothetical protein
MSYHRDLQSNINWVLTGQNVEESIFIKLAVRPDHAYDYERNESIVGLFYDSIPTARFICRRGMEGKGKGKVKLSLCLTKYHAMKTY